MARKAKEEAPATDLPADGIAEYQRFESLAKRVMAVPKDELERRQQMYEAESRKTRRGQGRARLRGHPRNNQ